MTNRYPQVRRLLFLSILVAANLMAGYAIMGGPQEWSVRLPVVPSGGDSAEAKVGKAKTGLAKKVRSKSGLGLAPVRL